MTGSGFVTKKKRITQRTPRIAKKRRQKKKERRGD
jgi:hypothetical protein